MLSAHTREPEHAPIDAPISELLRIEDHVPIRYGTLCRRILGVDPRWLLDVAADLYPRGLNEPASLREVQRWLTRDDVRGALTDLWFPQPAAARRLAPRAGQILERDELPMTGAAAALGISAKTLSKLCKKGDAPPFVWRHVNGNRARRFPVAELRRWAQENGRALRPF